MGIWFCGIVVQLVRNSPPFEPFAMVGGMLWCIGNATAVPVIQLVGLGVGMCVWGGSSLVMGWASGRFGILGVKTQKVENEAMNICGILLCIASIGIMFKVKTVKAEQEAAGKPFTDPLLTMLPDESSLSISTAALLDDVHGEEVALKRKKTNSDQYSSAGSSPGGEPLFAAESNWTEKLSPPTKKILGITLAMMAGLCYGCNFNPPQYLIDSGKGGSQHGIDYVFSHFTVSSRVRVRVRGALLSGILPIYSYLHFLVSSPCRASS